jgi:hypothetical protein
MITELLCYTVHPIENLKIKFHNKQCIGKRELRFTHNLYESIWICIYICSGIIQKWKNGTDDSNFMREKCSAGSLVCNLWAS